MVIPQMRWHTYFNGTVPQLAHTTNTRMQSLYRVYCVLLAAVGECAICVDSVHWNGVDSATLKG